MESEELAYYYIVNLRQFAENHNMGQYRPRVYGELLHAVSTKTAESVGLSGDTARSFSTHRMYQTRQQRRPFLHARSTYSVVLVRSRRCKLHRPWLTTPCHGAASEYIDIVSNNKSLERDRLHLCWTYGASLVKAFKKRLTFSGYL